jgi:drug/metabolite transporter (DMT)-like permease
MGGNKQYLKGILITLGGVLVVSSDALLIRMSGVSGFKAGFWRALFTFVSLFILFVSTRKRAWFTIIKSGGSALLFSSLLWGVSGISFSLGVAKSGAAVALVMVSLSPFFASAHSYLFYRTKPHALTLLAAVGAIGGIIYMYSSQLGTIGPKDFLYTVWTPLILGVNLSYLGQHPQFDRIAICSMGGLFGAIIAFFLAGMRVSVTTAELLPLLLLGAVVIPISQVSISSGTRYIPASESALISSLETIFGIFYVWIFLNEVPSRHTLIGGAIVLCCIIFNTLAQAYVVKR